MSKEKKATAIVEIFENLLEEKDIEIPCNDSEEENTRHDGGNTAKIYGMEYYTLIEQVQALL